MLLVLLVCWFVKYGRGVLVVVWVDGLGNMFVVVVEVAGVDDVGKGVEWCGGIVFVVVV